MFVFGPYYPKAAICQAIKLSQYECSAAGIRDVDEGEFFLVFMNGGKVTKTESFPRFGDFDDACLAKDIPRPKAQFIVDRNRGVHLMCR
jgi:hypothetical protein